ncbi:nuclear receptor subfamily 6 group A member 1-like [Lytechinus pictus]|uniref:nuclear receptor subfamily 6 group A member 1-like n=1 Tax=Lytechinus pictus TaxID=7653 RepID=UPI00240D4752|nr:nuclear receptor subfamily 6 group A member 1-like [Lytechinus pictus]
MTGTGESPRPTVEQLQAFDFSIRGPSFVPGATYTSTSISPVATDLGSPPVQDDGKSCLICGDRATGLHYGIVSCEGCKGFFKRSICNKRVYRCMRDKNCMMSRQKRNRCQYCRLLKCLQVGMNRKAIREDGMPGGRNKSIGPVSLSPEEIERIMSGEEYAREEMNGLATKSPNDGSDGVSPTFSPTSVGSSSSDHFFDFAGNPALVASGVVGISAVEYARRMERAEREASRNLALLPEVEALIMAEPTEPLTLPFEVATDQPVGYAGIFELLCKLMDRMLHHQIQWTKRLPFQSRIPISDSTSLLTTCLIELLLLEVMRTQPLELFTKLGQILDTYIPSEDELRKFGQNGLEIIDVATNALARYRALKVSVQEHVCLKVICFLNPENPNLTKLPVIKDLSKQYYYVLHDHVQLNNNIAAERFRELLILIPQIRHLALKCNAISFDNAPLLFKAIMHAGVTHTKR